MLFNYPVVIKKDTFLVMIKDQQGHIYNPYLEQLLLQYAVAVLLLLPTYQDSNKKLQFKVETSKAGLMTVQTTPGSDW